MRGFESLLMGWAGWRMQLSREHLNGLIRLIARLA